MNHYMNEMNVFGERVVAIDIPSGLDCDTGDPVGSVAHGFSDQALVVVADLTVTFVAEKLGFANPKSRHYTGDIVVGDIGCPREIIDRVLREISAPDGNPPT
jgi:NAD(P)H-hydrate epimerase